MTAWMLLYIGDLYVRKSELVVDRLKSLHLMQVWALRGLPVGFLLLRYSVLFTVESLSLLYLLVIS